MLPLVRYIPALNHPPIWAASLITLNPRRGIQMDCNGRVSPVREETKRENENGYKLSHTHHLSVAPASSSMNSKGTKKLDQTEEATGVFAIRAHAPACWQQPLLLIKHFSALVFHGSITFGFNIQFKQMVQIADKHPAKVLEGGISISISWGNAASTGLGCWSNFPTTALSDFSLLGTTSVLPIRILHGVVRFFAAVRTT